jgi:acyl-CoA thioester hydrolase
MRTVAQARVLMADTDAMGIVYHANYLRWFEVGRCELIRAAGLSYAQMEASGQSLPVVDARLRYRAPARYDDVLDIQATVIELGRVKLSFGYRILRAHDATLICEGETHHGCVDHAGRIVRFSAEVHAALRAAQDDSPNQ